MKKINIMILFCILLSACQSGTLKVQNATAKIDTSTLAAAIKAQEVSCDFQLSEKISEGEWELRFVFFKQGKIIFDTGIFGGYIGTPKSIKKRGKRIFVPNDRTKFDNINIKLCFIDVDYLNLNERVFNKKHYKVYLSVEAGRTGFSDTMFVPKSVLNLTGSDIGTFPENFKYPEQIIPVFYLREMHFWEEWEITEESLPSPKKDLDTFISAKYPDTTIICFLVKDFEDYLDFLAKYYPENEVASPNSDTAAAKSE
jgi:hypothetical protein